MPYARRPEFEGQADTERPCSALVLYCRRGVLVRLIAEDDVLSVGV